MSGTLSPDVIAAINKVAATPLGRKYDRMARRKYGKSGVALAAKEVVGESGGRSDAVSSAGARGLTQFMPGTRADYLRRYGVDAWASPTQAIKAMELYQTAGGGIESYNPGMPTYASYILNQRLDPATNRALIRNPGQGQPQPSSSGSKAGSFTLTGPKQTTVGLNQSVIPGQSFAAARQAARDNLFLTPGKLDMQKLLAYKAQMNGLQDIPDQTVNNGLTVKTTGGKPIKVPTKAPKITDQSNQAEVPLGGKTSGKSGFEITGPNPGRLVPELVKYARKVSRIYGGPLVGLDGSTHSKFTVNGRVSEHYTGHATDVFTIGGLRYGSPGWQKQLVRAGRAALIAAGMPRAQALKQNGGLYNVGRHQIIFNVNGVQYGGNHLDHLHISSH